jgi:2-phospho-L-lactate guanylyltransferase
VTWALVPVKGFGRAKSRLSVPPEARATLARSMMEHVVAAASAVLPRVAVVTDCAEVAALATRLGARALFDGKEQLGEVIDLAIAELQSSRVLVVMSDLPWLTGADLEEMLSLGADVVVAPDEEGEGTNALLLSRPMRTCFGNRGSFGMHCARANALSLSLSIVRREGLARDLDVSPPSAACSGSARLA